MTHSNLNEKRRVYHLLVRAVEKFKEEELTYKRLQELEASVSKVLLMAVKEGILDITKWSSDNEVTVSISNIDPHSVIVSMPRWIMDEIGIEVYEAH